MHKFPIVSYGSYEIMLDEEWDIDLTNITTKFENLESEIYKIKMWND